MNKYQKLKISYKISQELQDAIDRFLDYINNNRGSCEDCLRDEISAQLKFELHYKNSLTHEQYDELKAYYVYGSIYKQKQPQL